MFHLGPVVLLTAGTLLSSEPHKVTSILTPALQVRYTHEHTETHLTMGYEVSREPAVIRRTRPNATASYIGDLGQVNSSLAH